ncbi:MAG: serine/threonine protein kinase, partial [Chloroflexota bacterium]|nr:serine/threonine protein kinase [Chloroflexota bacterium]
MPTDRLIGQRLGDYEVEALLRAGTLSRLYVGEQTSRGRKVALKVPSAELARLDTFRRRFLADLRLVATIDHPHIRPVYEAGDADGTLYAAMSWIDGMDLAELLDRVRRLAPERALRIAGQVASALDAARARDLVHGDVRPANVLLDANDDAFLTDFGMAPVTSASRELTRTGALVGTAGYASPEQIRNETVSARSDVYSLACVLFRCLAGALPFDGRDERAVLEAQLRGSPARPSQYGLPRALDPVTARALAKAPDQRYASASAFVDAARAALDARPIPLAAPIAPVRTAPAAAPKLGRRKPAKDRIVVARTALARTARVTAPWRPRAVVAALLMLLGSGALVAGRSLAVPSPTSSPTTPPEAFAASVLTAAPTTVAAAATTLRPAPTPVPTAAPSTAAPTPAPTLAPSPAPSPTPPPTEPPPAQPSVVVVGPTPAPPSATPAATPSPLPQPSAPPAPSAVAILAPGIRADPPAIYRGQSVAFLLTSFSPGLVVDITVTDPDGFV